MSQKRKLRRERTYLCKELREVFELQRLCDALCVGVTWVGE